MKKQAKSMLHSKAERELKLFFNSLTLVTHPADGSLNQLFDSGLILFEPDTTTTITDIVSIFLPTRHKVFILNSQYGDELFVQAFLTANQTGQLLFVDCQADPCPPIIQILKGISEDNACIVTDTKTGQITKIALHPKTRIIFCLTEKVLSEKITYPFFTSLFGPILRLS